MKEHELGFVLPDFVELPSGLLAPVDIVAQGVPKDLPPGIELPRFKQVAIAHKTPPTPIESIRSWIDEPQLGQVATSFPQLLERIATLPFETATFAVCFLLRRLHSIQRNARQQVELARSVYGELDAVPDAMSRIVARDPTHMPFAEPLLVPLVRLLIEEAPLRSSLGERALELQMERCLLGVASALDDWSYQGHDVEEMPAWLGFFMRKSNYVRGKATLNELVRPHELLRLMSGSLDDRAEAERIDVDALIQRRYGLSAPEQFRLGFGIAAGLHLWDDEGPTAGVMRFPREGFENMLSAIGFEDEKRTAAFELVAGTREHFRSEFSRLDPERELLMGMQLPFQQRPLLQLGDGSLILVSPRFLHEWMTDGFHYRALDAVAGIPPNRRLSGRYLRFAGHIFERYCVELAESSHESAFAGIASVSGDVPYRTRRGEERTVDLAVSHGPDLTLFEIEHHRPGIPVSVRGAVNSAIEDVRSHLIHKVRRLIACVEFLRSSSGRAITGIEMHKVRRIWPVVVSVEAPPQQPPLWDFVDTEIGASLRREGAEPLTILDAEDFEMLLGAVEGGTSLGEILGRKTTPPYGRMELSAWFQSDPLAPRLQRPRAIEDAYHRMTEHAFSVFRATSTPSDV